MMIASTASESPSLARIAFTVASRSAMSTFSIFIASTMQSFAVSAKVAAGNDQAMRWGVDGTPTIVVDGKYRVQMTRDGGPTAMLHAVDWLVAKQRPEHAKH